MKTRKINPFAALAALAATTATVTAAGTLDSSFGAGGKAIANYGGTDSGNAVAIMPNGKIVVAGVTTALGNIDVAVLRYNANGTLDTTFDHDGGVITDLGAGTTDVANGVAVQPDGKILVAGGNGADSVVVRYNVDGSLDTFFGSNGRAIVSVGGTDFLNAITVRPNGKIVCGGTCWVGSAPDFGFLVLNPDGSPDNSFDSNGVRIIDFSADEGCQAITVLPDGSIIGAGFSNDVTSNDFAVTRIDVTGVLVNSFDGDGRLLTDFGGDDKAASIAIQPDGKIVVGGTNGTGDFAVARYSQADGSLDTTFGGGDGKVDETFGNADFVKSMVLQKDGKIVLAGTSNAVDANNDFALMRLKQDGTLDTTFAGDGTLLSDFGTASVDSGNAMAIQPDGRIVVVGSSSNNFATSRFNMITRTDARIGSKNTATSGNDVYNTTGAGQTQNITVAKSGGKKVSYVRIQNDGHSTEAFTVLGGGNTSNFTVRYLNGNVDITPNVVGGSFNTGNLAPGASFLIKVEVKAKTKKANKTSNFLVTGKAVSDATSTDAVLIKAKSK